MANATLSILPACFNLCFSPGLRLSLDWVEIDRSLVELLEKILSLSSFALEDVDEVVMVDDASEVDVERPLSFMAASRRACWRYACICADILVVRRRSSGFDDGE